MSDRKPTTRQKRTEQRKSSDDTRLADSHGCFAVVDECGCRVVDPCGCYTSQCCR